MNAKFDFIKKEKNHQKSTAKVADEPLLVSVLNVIKEIPQQGQVQYDLCRQLRELRVAANKLGLYDAADFIHSHCG